MSLTSNAFAFANQGIPPGIQTVKGFLPASAMGMTLIHEHILVDFIGAATYDPTRWDHDAVIKKVFPYLIRLKQAGCTTLVDCTPAFLGRDALLLKKISEQSGLNILTNTGYYGGSDNKYLPHQVFAETAEQLSVRWISEWENGIDGTPVKPGFIKISVNPDRLSEVSQKLIRAAARTHLKTGLTIASHTGPAIAAMEQLETLREEGVAPDAFIWVHAQTEKDKDHYVTAVRRGAWVSLDGISETTIQDYVQMIVRMKKEKCLHRTLLSHDAGWYDPGNPEAEFRGYTTLFDTLIPELKKNNFTEKEITQLIEVNPREVFSIRVRKL